MSGRTRDLLGYGFDAPRITWPNGARLAVSVVVNFEEGGKLSVGDGDPRNETFGEVASIVPPGRRDLPLEKVLAYGLRRPAGVP